MIVEICISQESCSALLPSGVNIKISRCDGEDTLSIFLEDDGGEQLFPGFEINYEELKLALLKLSWDKESK
jgi:hypothetical protein